MTLKPEREQEIASLAHRFGAPLRWSVTVPTRMFNPLDKTDRDSEVCMVVRRKDGGLITATKSYYPAGIYRLLTGGVNFGESIETALLRETFEETGLDVEVRSFLAVVEYVLHPPGGERSETPVFASFALLLDEVGGKLMMQDPDEDITDFATVPPEELTTLAKRLELLPSVYHEQVRGTWQMWGRFRAAAHRAVYAALVDET
jgi:8-oxo-dGTP pyrophosphatase MutT (NUDIX family)